MEVVNVVDDLGEGMQCTVHPFRNNPGGICAFCLQEKLGKLVSSSFPIPIFPSSSSSSPSSFRSERGGVGGVNGGVSGGGGGVLFASVRKTSFNDGNKGVDCHYSQYSSRRSRIPFLLVHKKKKVIAASSSVSASSSSDLRIHFYANARAIANIALKRSKSTTTTAVTPRRGRLFNGADGEDYSPRKRGFWSFLHLSSKTATAKRTDQIQTTTQTPASERRTGDSVVVVVEENESPTASSSSFGRKVSRSRSVGCGSRSFSGDFFERISTGFGDCTLRRVESQREGDKAKSAAAHRSSVGGAGDIIKERVRCGGIFSGFTMTSSSSSSSSSSYWISSSTEEISSGKVSGAVGVNGVAPLVNHRSKNWGWAFASPMRAFSKPSKDAKQRNSTPNLDSVPSLLSVRS